VNEAVVAVRSRNAARRVRWVAGRLGGALFVAWGAATVTFLSLHLMPGSPAMAYAGGAQAHPSRAELAYITHEYGLDHTFVVQYLLYIGRLLEGNLGYSPSQQQTVASVIAQNVWPTLELTLCSLALAWGLAVVSSLLSVKRGRFAASFGSGIEILTASLPQYWLGILLLEVLAFHFRFFPATGGSGVAGLVLPSLTLAIPLAGFIGQVTREEFESALEQPYVISARARGMGDWGVRFRHGLRHAILPGLTMSGWALGALISGAVIVETLFSRQGLGNVLLQGVSQADMPLTIGVVLVVALVYVVANLVVDVLYVAVDPRLKAS
jgi:peptide/nickel transport system permease protein